VGPGTLAEILKDIPAAKNENLLVGLETSDDAGVYRLTPETALIQTMDFFTPVVDDPYVFGQIAAANALSDIYAMGGQPLTAMNIVCFPARTLPLAILKEIIRGGADKIAEAGAVLVGGHSVEDREPKYGLSVTGIVHPQNVWTNRGARPGDALILTKPLGTGIAATAIKAGLASQDLVDKAVEVMSTLNRNAAETARTAEINACTDITGFGLLGHAYEMAAAGSIKIIFSAGAIPILAGVQELAANGIIPGGAYANRDYLSSNVAFAGDVDENTRAIFFDPQTSGGLLFSVPAANAGPLLERLHAAGIKDAAVIGKVTAGQTGIEVTG
jgi:selenide,water dikinase